MKRVFFVEVVINRKDPFQLSRRFEVVANNAEEAIKKATSKIRKDENWKGSVVILNLRYRGRAL